MTHPGVLAVYGAAIVLVLAAALGLVPGGLATSVAVILLLGIGVRLYREQRRLASERATLEGQLRDVAQRMELQGRELAIARARITDLEADLAEEHKLGTVGRLTVGVAHQATLPMIAIAESQAFLGAAFERLRQLVANLRILVVQADPRSGEAQLDEADRRANTRHILSEAPRALARAQDGVTRVSSVLRAVQDFAAPTDGRLTDTDIAGCVDTAVEVSRDRWSRIAELTVHHDAGLPRVPAARDEINQVLLALILNATDAIHTRYPDVRAPVGRIDIRTFPVDGGVEIHVSDTGIGIEHERQQQVLSGASGSLAHVRRTILRKHGGELTIQSQPGVGTTLRILLPAAATHLVQLDLGRAAK